jgi:hypothetical protein
MNRFVVSMHFFLFSLLLSVVWALPRGPYVLVVASPGAAPAKMMSIIGDAGGSFVSAGRFTWIAVAYSNEGHFPARLMKAGAVLVLNHGLAVGCQQKDS